MTYNNQDTTFYLSHHTTNVNFVTCDTTDPFLPVSHYQTVINGRVFDVAVTESDDDATFVITRDGEYLVNGGIREFPTHAKLIHNMIRTA